MAGRDPAFFCIAMTDPETVPETTPSSAATSPAAAETAKSSDGKSSEGRQEILRVVVRPYPKVVFFYLTWIASFVCGLVTSLGTSDPAIAEGARLGDPLIGQIWMGIFFFNLLVISFDFNEERSLAMLFGGVAAVLALLYFGVLGAVGEWVASIHPLMNDAFYWMIFVGFSIVYLFVWLRTRFDYWVFRPNEVVHHYGVFPKMKRYSTEHMRWVKEIPDLMERVLMGSGRIIISTPHESHPVVIEHVLRIGTVDDQIASIMGVKEVVASPGTGRS
ncbi:MAG: hypothetical protein DWQ01_17490 [Planctomycetota bacterium]|nr:MAG: hypothetical protein DWQ01_17490 [Planctomycetota bacterium]